MTSSEARKASDNQGIGKNSIPIRQREDQEVEIREGERRLPPQEHIYKEVPEQAASEILIQFELMDGAISIQTRHHRRLLSAKKTIGNKLYVLAHEISIHPHKSTGEGITDELPLYIDSIGNNFSNPILRELVVEETVEKASKVTVQTLVTRYELVGEGETGH
ncbi:hypothetical protein M5K25_025279 [Dendrobium thyrsiflorum]|uniref:Uncharacterized protein n=1 Tax=Dendrobium thyrsiflorum TaxID=117978 RepID=A0ABD0U417_DENTH